MSVAVGTFGHSTDAVGTEISITGVGFQPDVVIFFWGGRSSTGGPTNNDNNPRGSGLGFAISATERFVVSAGIQGIADPYASVVYSSDEACAVVADSGGKWAALDFVSMDADGFTVVVDDEETSDTQISYMAIDGLDASYIGQLTMPASTGNQSITGVGFQPDFVLFVSAMDASTPPATGSDAKFALGCMSADAQWALYAQDNDGQGLTVTRRYGYGSECIATGQDGGGVGGPRNRAEFVSMDSDGFTINWLECADSQIVGFLAMKGGEWFVGQLTGQGSTGQFSETGVGFEPEGVFFGSVCEGEHTQDTQTDDWEVSLGAFDGTNQAAHATEKDDGATLGDEHNHIHSTDSIYHNVGGGSTPNQEGEIQGVSLDSDGFTLDQTDADTAELFYFCFRQIAVTPRNRLVRYFHNAWASRAAGRSVFYDILGRIVPPEQLEEDSWSYGDGPAFPTPMKPSSLIRDDRAFYHESVMLSGEPPETAVETQREGLLENVMRRISRGS